MEISLSSARSLAVLLLWGPERRTDRQTDSVGGPYHHLASEGGTDRSSSRARAIFDIEHGKKKKENVAVILTELNLPWPSLHTDHQISYYGAT